MRGKETQKPEIKPSHHHPPSASFFAASATTTKHLGNHSISLVYV